MLVSNDPGFLCSAQCDCILLFSVALLTMMIMTMTHCSDDSDDWRMMTKSEAMNEEARDQPGSP